jgi:hypothetical protein
MQFWPGTAFMKTSEAVAVARMLDDAGFDGIVCSDHMIYPRDLSSPYPDSPTGRPPWPPETAWPDSWVLIGAMASVTHRLRHEYGRDDEPFEILLALTDPPSVDLYKRAEDAGITAVMAVPWMGAEGMGSGGVERFRAPIARFAETVIEKFR